MNSFIRNLIVFGYILPIFTAFAGPTTEDKIRNYFNSLQDMKAQFVQVDEYGNTQTGKLFLSIPGKLRWEYNTPREVVMIMHENKVYYYDKELDHGSHYIGNKGLASIFSGRDVFSLESIKVLSVTGNDDTSKVLFGNTESPEKIMLIFNNNPFSIEGLLIENENKDKVAIQLNNTKINDGIDNKLFQYKTPSPKRKK